MKQIEIFNGILKYFVYFDDFICPIIQKHAILVLTGFFKIHFCQFTTTSSG